MLYLQPTYVRGLKLKKIPNKVWRGSEDTFKSRKHLNHDIIETKIKAKT